MTGKLIQEKVRSTPFLKFGLRNSSGDKLLSHFITCEIMVVFIYKTWRSKKLESIRDKINQFPMKEFSIWTRLYCFTHYKLIIFLLPNNLKEENKTTRGSRLLYIAIRMSPKKSLFGSSVSIGKYANSSCFKNVNIDNFNCHYRPNKIKENRRPLSTPLCLYIYI